MFCQQSVLSNFSTILTNFCITVRYLLRLSEPCWVVIGFPSWVFSPDGILRFETSAVYDPQKATYKKQQMLLANFDIKRKLKKASSLFGEKIARDHNFLFQSSLMQLCCNLNCTLCINHFAFWNFFNMVTVTISSKNSTFLPFHSYVQLLSVMFIVQMRSVSFSYTQLR